MNIKEMMRLQGIDPETFKQVVSDSVMGQQLGNAMSVNVMERILAKALLAAGLIQKPNLKASKLKLNRWESGEGLATLRPKVSSHSLLKSPMTCKSDDNKWPKDKLSLMSTRSQRKIVIDSGASEHLVNEADCTEEELATRRPIENVRRVR